jgi:tRNA threonylcarbamoyladenosine biosynthesis protein TsaB
MLVLALDTTTRAGSAALLDGDRIVAERDGDGSRTHAERLPAEITELLAAHGRSVADVELFAVASGPGSFTGLRIGIATMQGLAFVRRRPIVGVPALDALAHLGRGGLSVGARIGVWMDAHRREVFSALYRIESATAFTSGSLVALEGATVGSPADALGRWAARDEMPAALIGDGATLYGDVAVAAAVHVVAPPALAGAIGRLAQLRDAGGAPVYAPGVQPLYVRRPDAEIDRERRASRGQTPGAGAM